VCQEAPTPAVRSADDAVERRRTAGRNARSEAVEQPQRVIREGPDRCFVCGELVPDDASHALIPAFLGEGRRDRLAAMRGRRPCLLALQDATNSTWRRFLDAPTHRPDRAIYPHGPCRVIRRPHQLTFRTAPRPTAVNTAASPEDPDDVASLPCRPSRPAHPRPHLVVRARAVPPSPRRRRRGASCAAARG
jgi:hypothetical protein